jgi:hypothetical protein
MDTHKAEHVFTRQRLGRLRHLCSPGYDRTIDRDARAVVGRFLDLDREQSMAAIKIYLPRQWTDWVTWLLGIWLCLSPWALLFEFDETAVRNAVLLGALIILVEVIELSGFRGWEEWINVALGVWLIASTWFLGIATPAARINFVLVGVLVVALAFNAMLQIHGNLDNHK